jgi:hypothetical protein
MSWASAAQATGDTTTTTELFDFAPDGDPVAGPGDHTLTVDLPSCSEFIVDFVAFAPETAPQDGAQMLSQAKTDAVRVMAEGDQPPDDSLLDEMIGETTNCPTETTNGEVAPTTTGAPGKLPFTGTNAMPMLVAGLVLVAGGGTALAASRMRRRQAK